MHCITMYCIRCGSPIAEGSRYCPHCGAAQNDAQNPYRYPQPSRQPSVNDDLRSSGWIVFGFFFPIIGLVLSLVWRKDRRNAAKNVRTGALIGGILQAIAVILYILIFIFVYRITDNISHGYYAISSLPGFVL